MIKQARVPCFLLCLTILVGCSVPFFPTPESFPEPTHIYQTVSAGLTATAYATSVLTLTQPVLRTVTPGPNTLISLTTPAARVTVTAPAAVDLTALPCNRASAGKPSIDVTVPDGTLLKPGEAFSKTWRVVNSGSCTWTSDYALVWFSGDSFSSVRRQNFSADVPGGQSVDVTVDMVAPDQAGIHQSNWKFSAPNGSLFGLGPAGDAPVWVRIEVENLSTPAADLGSTPTPTSVVAMKDTVMLGLNQSIDLDIGKINAGPADDLGIVANGNGTPSLMPLNGSRVVIFGSQAPIEADCRVATLSNDGIVLSTISENSYICYRTNAGLPGFGKLSNITNNSFTLFYTTWMVP